MSLPEKALIVGYAFMYDLTKILKDMPDELLYMLLHEDARRFKDADGKEQHAPVKWKGYSINFMNRRLTLKSGSKTITVWDIFRFYQGKFTTTLIDWNIGETADIEAMAEMKDKRDIFDQLSIKQVHEYCFSECQHLAKLARALIVAHKDVDLKLTSFYGAGSTASALLKKLGIKSYLKRHPEKMNHAVASAFFGGRFENSVVGPVQGPIYTADISSAYPYQTTFLPCLVHGKWEHHLNPRIKDIEDARLALIHWQTHYIADRMAWGPFPVRMGDGSIIFPKSCKGGWVWKDEYLQACKTFRNVSHSDAWLYHTDCDCQPFSALPVIYRERIRIGKNGKGIVLKLGPNSTYGKLAQSKGTNPPFQSWVLAGNITSGVRSQLLYTLTIVPDMWNIIMFATDSVSSTYPISDKLPIPRDTGTWEAIDDKGKIVKKPLGGWEPDVIESGVFCVRPGIYFPLEPTEKQLKEVKARGLGKKVLYDNWQKIVEQYEQDGHKEILEIEGISRFVGAKSAISHSPKRNLYKRSRDYGEWVPHPINVSFSPYPKRCMISPDNRLELWGKILDESLPYDPAMISPDTNAINQAVQIAEEQPDAELIELDLND